MSLWQDWRNCLWYGSPNVFAFVCVHTAIFYGQATISEQVLEDNFVANKYEFEKGRYYKLLCSMCMHGSAAHLAANCMFFAPLCYRCLDSLSLDMEIETDASRKRKKSAAVFWFMYLNIGFWALAFNFKLQQHRKQLLLFCFQNDAKIRQEIEQKYDSLNWCSLSGIGASAAVYGLSTFNCCLCIKRTIKRLYKLYASLFADDDGLIDITDTSTAQFDILDYDLNDTHQSTLGHSTQGMDLDDKLRYESLKLCEDVLWSVCTAWFSWTAIRDMHRWWRYGLQQRGGFDILEQMPSLYRTDFTAHFTGVLSGAFWYCMYELFCVNWSRTERDKAPS